MRQVSAICLVLMLLSAGCIGSDDESSGEDKVTTEDPVQEEEEILYEGDAAGECSDEADNDRDGLFDCDDDECAGSPVCKENEEGNTPIRLNPQKRQNFFTVGYEFSMPEEFTVFAYTFGDNSGLFVNSYGPYHTKNDYQIVIGAVENGRLDYRLEDSNETFSRVWFTNLSYIENIHDYILTLNHNHGGYGGLYYMDDEGRTWDQKEMDFIVWAIEKGDFQSFRGQDFGTGTSRCTIPHNFEFTNYDGGVQVEVRNFMIFMDPM